MVIVNKEGERVMNEKSAYDTRVRLHWESPEEGYPNHFLFLVGDERCADTFGANFAKTWPADLTNKYYIKGETLTELAANIEQRLVSIEAKLDAPFSLGGDFAAGLAATVERFNGFAEMGKDLDFGRGEGESDSQWTCSGHPTAGVGSKANATMYPLSPTGPYYCLILAPSLIDTKGGPTIDTNANVLDTEGRPIPGLYGAGNCASPISGDAYWSGGATIGTAMTTGWVAGKAAAGRPDLPVA